MRGEHRLLFFKKKSGWNFSYGTLLFRIIESQNVFLTLYFLTL